MQGRSQKNGREVYCIGLVVNTKNRKQIEKSQYVREKKGRENK